MWLDSRLLSDHCVNFAVSEMLLLDILGKTASTSSSLAIPFTLCYVFPRASLVAQRVKRLPTMRETRVRSLGGEHPRGEKMATHSSILAWRIPGTEEPGGLQSQGSQRVGHDLETKQQRSS